MRAEHRLNDFQMPLKVGYLWRLGNGLLNKIDSRIWNVNGKKHETGGEFTGVCRHGPGFL